MLYQGRFDKNKPTYEAAWKAWNLAFNAAPKKNVVSLRPVCPAVRLSRALTWLSGVEHVALVDEGAGVEGRENGRKGEDRHEAGHEALRHEAGLRFRQRQVVRARGPPRAHRRLERARRRLRGAQARGQRVEGGKQRQSGLSQHERQQDLRERKCGCAAPR